MNALRKIPNVKWVWISTHWLDKSLLSWREGCVWGLRGHMRAEGHRMA